MQVKIAKPLGAVMEEAEDGLVRVREVKEGGNAAATQALQVGDEILRVNGKLLKSAGFDSIMADLVAAEGEVELTMARPIPDRDVDFASLSEEEQKARYQSAGVIKVPTPPLRLRFRLACQSVPTLSPVSRLHLLVRPPSPLPPERHPWPPRDRSLVVRTRIHAPELRRLTSTPPLRSWHSCVSARGMVGGVQVCSDGPCTRQGAKNVVRWGCACMAGRRVVQHAREAVPACRCSSCSVMWE